MSNPPKTPTSRRTALILVAVLVLVIAIVVIIVSTTGGTSTTPAGTTSSTAPQVSTTATSPLVPQTTQTVALSKPATIAGSLTASVTKQEAITGTANGPGEVAGPSVRFTITITNGTAKAVGLANTVVNAYFGADRQPAIQLEGPGGKPFPQSVAAGSTATGVFVFNIPSDQRSKVEVTVDTSVSNPVVAFQGAAPR